MLNSLSETVVMFHCNWCKISPLSLAYYFLLYKPTPRYHHHRHYYHYYCKRSTVSHAGSVMYLKVAHCQTLAVDRTSRTGLQGQGVCHWLVRHPDLALGSVADHADGHGETATGSIGARDQSLGARAGSVCLPEGDVNGGRWRAARGGIP